MNVAVKVAHYGLETGLHMNLYSPAATFCRLLCLHKLKKRLSKRDRKRGEGGNDEGRKRERQLMKEEEEEMESRRLKKKKRMEKKKTAEKGEGREGWPSNVDSVKY